MTERKRNGKPRSTGVPPSPREGPASNDWPPEVRRRLLADLCRLLAATLDGSGEDADVQTSITLPQVDGLRLTPRVRQTLGRLLAGDSEKQIARRMGVSHHTVHVYVKTLYRIFEVNSRGELLARFVAPPFFTLGADQSPRRSATCHEAPGLRAKHRSDS